MVRAWLRLAQTKKKRGNGKGKVKVSQGSKAQHNIPPAAVEVCLRVIVLSRVEAERHPGLHGR